MADSEDRYGGHDVKSSSGNGYEGRTSRQKHKSVHSEHERPKSGEVETYRGRTWNEKRNHHDRVDKDRSARDDRRRDRHDDYERNHDWEKRHTGRERSPSREIYRRRSRSPSRSKSKRESGFDWAAPAGRGPGISGSSPAASGGSGSTRGTGSASGATPGSDQCSLRESLGLSLFQKHVDVVQETSDRLLAMLEKEEVSFSKPRAQTDDVMDIVDQMVAEGILKEGSLFWCFIVDQMVDANCQEMFLAMKRNDLRLAWMQFPYDQKARRP